MRKYVWVVCVVFLSLFSIAFAQQKEFTFRNGIQFGDTMEDVISKETLTLVERKYSQSNDLYLETSKDYSIGTVEHVKIRYDFSNNSLFRISWYMDYSADKSMQDSNYSELKKALISKYGSPLSLGKNQHSKQKTSMLAGTLDTIEYLHNTDQEGNLIYYSEWLFDYGVKDYQLKIDLLEGYQKVVFVGNKYYVRLCYEILSESQDKIVLQEKREQLSDSI